MDSFRRANKSYKVRMECQHAHSPLHSCRLQIGKKKKQQKLQASISKVKPELRIAKSLENPQREKEERNEPRTKYLRAEFYEKDWMPKKIYLKRL